MDVIINDFSLDGQFKDANAFFDALGADTLPAFYSLINKNCEILSSFETYNRRVSEDLTLHNVLSKGQWRGYPEATKLKSFLAQCASEPFWEAQPQTDCSLTYDIAHEDVHKIPNCFTETFARNGILLSFPNAYFASNGVEIIVKGQQKSLPHAHDKDTSGHALFYMGMIGLSELLGSAKSEKTTIFYKNNGKYYSDEAFVNENLSIEDGLSIFKDFKLSLEFIERGELKSRFSDSISFRNITYYEFRCSLSSNREFRIYYFLDHEKLVYLNSIVKKTAKTPDNVKQRTISLIKKYREERR